MALIKSTITMRNLSVSLFLIFSISSLACGWYESAETIRLALFRSERNGSEKFRSFYYSADIYFQTYIYSKRDNVLNSKEWQRELGGKVTWKDVYILQYETDPIKFQSAFKSNSLKEVFKGNTFIEALVLPKNKALLEYFADAKHTEFNYQGTGGMENWDKLSNNYDDEKKTKNYEFQQFKSKLLAAKTNFLKQRYAYLLMRTYSVDSKEMIRLYDTYFTNLKQKTILQPWALFFKAISTENTAEANYYLSQVLASCDDKSFATMQWFSKKDIEQTLSYAKNDTEKGNIIAMKALRNPAPALEEIKKVYEYIPNSDIFSVLIGREVNKLEDWIFMPKFSSQSESESFKNWYDFEVVREKNFLKDIKYLQEFRNFLILEYSNFEGEQKDYISSAIAQLSFMDDAPELGKKYASLISANANTSILAQKNIQLALVEIKLGDVNSGMTKEILLQSIDKLRDLAEKDQSLFKSLYSLTRLVAYEYEKNKDIRTAGFLFDKSERYKNFFEGYSNYYYGENTQIYYDRIGYFDQNASEKDMDAIIELVKKKEKTPFEKYLCSDAAPVDFYRDVKGTIAFRNLNLELASKTFSEMDQNFWSVSLQFKDYLNENPFLPLIANKTKRTFDYKFNKAIFLRELVDLSKLNTPESNLKLANAYYNVSTFGNSWMMISYGKGWNYSASSSDYYSLQRKQGPSEEEAQKKNFYTCRLAKEYYHKVLASPKSNSEQKAMATLMIHVCDYKVFMSQQNYGSKEVFKPRKEIFEFYSKYSETTVFKQFSCPLLENFVK